MRDLIPLSTDKWLTNNWPMTDRYCAISYQFFWLESLFLVILDCKSILVLLIYWFYEIFPSISIFNNVFILFFRCCCNKYVTGVTLLRSCFSPALDLLQPYSCPAPGPANPSLAAFIIIISTLQLFLARREPPFMVYSWCIHHLWNASSCTSILSFKGILQQYYRSVVCFFFLCFASKDPSF